MPNVALACLYASMVILAFGTLDRLTGARTFIPGVAPEAFWKGGMMLLAYAVVLRLWPLGERRAA
jgi:hypothetical protein